MKKSHFWLLVVLFLLSSIGFAQVGIWKRLADMPTPRAVVATAVVDGKIYVIGGTNPWPFAIATVEMYDPDTDTWTTKASMPGKRGWLSAAVVDGKIYAFGGADVENRDRAVAIVEVYDPVTDTWAEKEEMPTARKSLVTVAVDGKIYAIGGWGGWFNNVIFSIVEAYDPKNDRWIERAEMPTPRNSPAASVVDGQIYVIGGNNVGNLLFQTVEVFNPRRNLWTKKRKMPIEGLFSAVAIGDQIYLVGNTVERLMTIERYDPRTDMWTRIDEQSPTKWGYTVAAIGGKIYRIGGGWIGAGNTMIPVVEVYDTGVTPRSVDAAGKLTTTWGKIKVNFD